MYVLCDIPTHSRLRKTNERAFDQMNKYCIVGVTSIPYRHLRIIINIVSKEREHILYYNW